MATLPFVPSRQASISTKPQLKVARFGDGYVHRVVDGIHPTPDKWNLKFHLTSADRTTMIAFLKANVGVTIDWTPPEEVTVRKWAVLDGWSQDYVSYNHWEVSFTLEEVFV